LNDKIKVERNLADGYETIEIAAPAVVTTSYEVGALREPGVEAFMSANKKPLTVWNAQALGIDIAKPARTKFTKMFQPVREGKCQMVEGTGPEEKARTLVTRLKESKVI
jgi:electron transfer flavoprotein beta subunit